MHHVIDVQDILVAGGILGAIVLVVCAIGWFLSSCDFSK